MLILKQRIKILDKNRKPNFIWKILKFYFIYIVCIQFPFQGCKPKQAPKDLSKIGIEKIVPLENIIDNLKSEFIKYNDLQNFHKKKVDSLISTLIGKKVQTSSYEEDLYLYSKDDVELLSSLDFVKLNNGRNKFYKWIERFVISQKSEFKKLDLEISEWDDLKQHLKNHGFIVKVEFIVNSKNGQGIYEYAHLKIFDVSFKRNIPLTPKQKTYFSDKYEVPLYGIEKIIYDNKCFDDCYYLGMAHHDDIFINPSGIYRSINRLNESVVFLDYDLLEQYVIQNEMWGRLMREYEIDKNKAQVHQHYLPSMMKKYGHKQINEFIADVFSLEYCYKSGLWSQEKLNSLFLDFFWDYQSNDQRLLDNYRLCLEAYRKEFNSRGLNSLKDFNLKNKESQYLLGREILESLVQQANDAIEILKIEN